MQTYDGQMSCYPGEHLGKHPALQATLAKIGMVIQRSVAQGFALRASGLRKQDDWVALFEYTIVASIFFSTIPI